MFSDNVVVSSSKVKCPQRMKIDVLIVENETTMLP
jgi:hypothetical protein